MTDRYVSSRRIGLLPGSFDPPTKAHIGLVIRAAKLVDHLVIGIGAHHNKVCLLDAETRCQMVSESISHLCPDLNLSWETVVFNGLTVDAARKYGAAVIFRGVRDGTDFDYEARMAELNLGIAPEIDTALLCASPEDRAVSATLIKQIAALGGDLQPFLTPQVAQAVRSALKQSKKSTE